MWKAYSQLQTYKDEISDLLAYNVALVISDGITARVGSLTANKERLMPWNTIKNEDDRPRLEYNVALVISDGITARVGSLTANKERFMPWNTIKNEDDRPLLEYQLEKVIRGFFDPELFLDYMRYFALFEDDGDSLIKKIAGYHQFHGVREAVRVTTIASADSDDGAVREKLGDYRKGSRKAGKPAASALPLTKNEVQPGSRKAGVFWHTQGSGKSVSMCCYAGKLLPIFLSGTALAAGLVVVS